MSRVDFGEAARGYEISIQVSIHMLTVHHSLESIISPRVSCLTLKPTFPKLDGIVFSSLGVA